MSEFASDVTEETIANWLHPENLRRRNHREFAGFSIVDSIDGGKDLSREVSLVEINAVGKYPQHVHKASDAFFFIVSGKGTLLTGKDRRLMHQGDTIEIPRGMPHGFELEEGAKLQFISIQSPPIRHPKTGEEDLHLTDIV